MDLVFIIHSNALYMSLIGAISPFTFRVIIERYEFSAIVLPVELVFLVMFSDPSSFCCFWSFYFPHSKSPS